VFVGTQRRKRGYSTEFAPHGQSGKRYLLDKIPAGLWMRVRRHAAAEGLSLRWLILSLLRDWVAAREQVTHPQEVHEDH
jgi:hypothetical protein